MQHVSCAGLELPLSEILRAMINKIAAKVSKLMNLGNRQSKDRTTHQWNELLDDLEDQSIILERHHECIDGMKEHYEKRILLLEVIQRRSDMAYMKFLDALTSHEYVEAASLLRDTGKCTTSNMLNPVLIAL